MEDYRPSKQVLKVQLDRLQVLFVRLAEDDELLERYRTEPLEVLREAEIDTELAKIIASGNLKLMLDLFDGASMSAHVIIIPPPLPPPHGKEE